MKLAVIGCGGINSWSIKNLRELFDTFYKDDVMHVTLFDGDIVEEKNLLRSNQNFLVEDLMMNKAVCLGDRYGFMYRNLFIDESNIINLNEFSHIIVGVDNNKTRRIIYKHCLDNDKYCLDLKAQGTQISYVVVDGSKDIKYYDEKYFNNIELMEKKGSCQLAIDVQNDHIENGNKIIATLGIYGIFLKRLRGEQPNAMEFKFAY